MTKIAEMEYIGFFYLLLLRGIFSNPAIQANELGYYNNNVKAKAFYEHAPCLTLVERLKYSVLEGGGYFSLGERGKSLFLWRGEQGRPLVLIGFFVNNGKKTCLSLGIGY